MAEETSADTFPLWAWDILLSFSASHQHRRRKRSESKQVGGGGGFSRKEGTAFRRALFAHLISLFSSFAPFILAPPLLFSLSRSHSLPRSWERERYIYRARAEARKNWDCRPGDKKVSPLKLGKKPLDNRDFRVDRRRRRRSLSFSSCVYIRVYRREREWRERALSWNKRTGEIRIMESLAPLGGG